MLGLVHRGTIGCRMYSLKLLPFMCFAILVVSIYVFGINGARGKYNAIRPLAASAFVHSNSINCT